MHKNRPLLKPMVLVTSTGYIIDIIGPYYANGSNNDAQILKHLIVGFFYNKDFKIFNIYRPKYDMFNIFYRIKILVI